MRFLVSLFVFLVALLGSSYLGLSDNASLAVGGICAFIYLIYPRKKKESDKKSKPSGSHSSSRPQVYCTKRYSPEDVARLLVAPVLYACRFEEGSDMKRIDAVTRARIVLRGGERYMELPERISGSYKLEHGYSHYFKGGIIVCNEGGDVWFLMDSQKRIVVYD